MTSEAIDAPWTRGAPSSWNRTYLGHLVDVQSGATPSKDEPSFWDGPIPWVSPKDMKVLRISDAEDHVSEGALLGSALRWVAAGSVLMVTRGMILDHTVPIALAERPLTINQDMKALRPRGDLRGEFLMWLLVGLNPALLARVEEAAHGTKALRTEQWRKLPLAIPPEPLQRRIADFLDAKTAHIDTLIARQQQLLALLAEKRQGLITRAVTRGLDPSATMKDSGVDWIGKVPAHWQLRRLRYLSDRISGRLVFKPAQYFVDSGVPFLMGNNITEDGVVWDNLKYISEETNASFAHHALRCGDVVTVRVGAPGVTCVVPQLADGVNCGSMMIIRRSSRFSSAWLAFVMNSPVVRTQIDLVQYGAAQEQINIGDALDFILPVPPLQEQQVIAATLEREITSHRQAATAISGLVERLREYRQALITSVVTGKVDVGGAVRGGRTKASHQMELDLV